MRKNKSNRLEQKVQRLQGRMANPKKGAERRKEVGRKAGRIALAIGTGGIAPAVGSIAKKLKANKRKMAKMVESAGVTPSENLSELAVQTTAVRDAQIENIVNDNDNYPEVQDYETAEEVWEGEQEEGASEYEDEFDGENDYFTADALSTIVGTAKGVIEKVKAGRLAKGKKFLGKSAEEWKKKGAGKGIGLNVAGDGLQISGLTSDKSDDIISSAVAGAKSEAIQDNLKKYLPIILILVVVVIFGKRFFK